MIRSVLVALCLIFVVAASAQDGATTRTLSSAAPARFGFVDVELVLAESEAIRSIVGEIDEELGKRDSEIREKRRELQKLKLALDTQSAVLAAEERERRQQRAVTLLNEIDEMEYRFDREVKRKQGTIVEPLLEQVVKVVGEVGRREGYDLIVRGEMVLWGARSVDLTPVVVKELDRQRDRLRDAVRRANPTSDSPAATPTPAPIPLIP